MGNQDPRVLEQEADRCAEAGDYAGAVALRERAFAGWRAAGDLRRAAYLAAYRLAFDHAALFGNHAVAQGWLERGSHLAQQAGDCVESGWVALSLALFDTDPEARARHVEQATALAARHGDADLGFDALAHTGLVLVEQGRVGQGMRHLDEAAAAARGGEVGSPVVAGEIYCKLFDACESALDVRRAEEWLGVMAPLGADPSLAWVPALCRTHFSGILVVAGRWSEAERELEESLRLYDASYRALRSSALARLAELRARQGRLSEARALLPLGRLDGYAVRARARTEWLVAQGHGERAAAAASLARSLASHGRLLDVPLMAQLVDMQLAGGDLPGARRTTEAVLALTAAEPVEALVGYARQCRAGVTAAEGRATDRAADDLRSAIDSFAASRLPLEAAVGRLRLAELLRATDAPAARSEAEGAAVALAALGARIELDRANALLRALGGRPRAGDRRGQLLTERESEVLALLAQGLSNPQIADRLFISPKTASHHVSNLLAKLGVRNRAEAAAWAVAHDRTTAR